MTEIFGGTSGAETLVWYDFTGKNTRAGRKPDGRPTINHERVAIRVGSINELGARSSAILLDPAKQFSVRANRADPGLNRKIENLHPRELRDNAVTNRPARCTPAAQASERREAHSLHLDRSSDSARARGPHFERPSRHRGLLRLFSSSMYSTDPFAGVNFGRRASSSARRWAITASARSRAIS